MASKSADEYTDDDDVGEEEEEISDGSFEDDDEEDEAQAPSAKASSSTLPALQGARTHSGLDMLRAIRQIKSLDLPQTERLGDLDDIINAANLTKHKRQKGRLGVRLVRSLSSVADACSFGSGGVSMRSRLT